MVVGAVDGAEGLLEALGLREHRIALEQFAEATAFALAEALVGLEQAVTGSVELGVPGVQASAAASTFGSPAALLALTFAANGVQCSVGAADEMEVIADDLCVRQQVADRLTVGLRGVDRDDLDGLALLHGQRAQEALDGPPRAAVDDIDNAAAIEIGDDRRELAPAAVMGLIERQPARQRGALPGGISVLGGPVERPGHLIAGGSLFAGDLGVSAAAHYPRA